MDIHGATTFSRKEEPYIRAVPIKLSVRFYPVRGGRIKAYLTAGAGLYLARLDRTGTTNEGLSDAADFHYDATAAGFGFHGGLGFEAELTGALGLLLEIEGRYAPVKNFSGTGTWEDTSGVLHTMTGEYYYFESIPYFTGVKGLLFEDHPPDSSYYFGVRKGVLDFSGYSIRAGLFIRI